jgi:hypothetical protein
MDSVRKKTSANSSYHVRFLTSLLLCLIATGVSKPSLAATPTQTTLLANPASSIAFQHPVQLVATVTDGVGNPITLGTVNFYDGNTVLGTVHLVGNGNNGLAVGSATLWTNSLTQGAHSLSARYNGTTTNSPSSSLAQGFTVTAPGPYPSMTLLQSSGNINGYYGLTATVLGFGPASPSGSVTFTDTTAGTALGTKALSGTPNGPFGFNTTTGLCPGAIVSGDFNNDGIQDLVVSGKGYVNGSCSGGAMLQTLLGNGSGTFTAGQTMPYPGGKLLAADFNGDGNLDLYDGNGYIYLGNGDGSFQLQNGAQVPAGALAGDINGDGIPDLVTAVGNNGYVTVSLGKGDGTFDAGTNLALSDDPALSVNPNDGSYTPYTPYPTCFAVGDLNHDGKDEIVVGAGTGVQVLSMGDSTEPISFINTGSGISYDIVHTGDYGMPVEELVGYQKASFIALADLNGDGNLDIITGNNGVARPPWQGLPGIWDQVSVNLGDGTGGFSGPSSYQISSIDGITGLLVGDFNNDQKLDVKVNEASWSSYEMDVLVGDGSGRLSWQTWYDQLPPVPIGYVDLLNDGMSDPVLPLGQNGLEITHPASVASISLSNVTVPSQGPQLITAAYSGDSNYAASTSASTLTTTLVISPPAVAPIFSPPSGTYSSVQTVTISDSSPGVSIHYTTDGTIPTPGSTPYTGPISVPASVTLKAMAFGGGYGPSPAVSATYTIITTTSTLTVTGSDPYGMACSVVGPEGTSNAGPTGTVTFNDVTANQLLGTATLSAPTTARSFRPQSSYPVGKNPSGIAYGDFNNDEKIDVAAVNATDNTVSILLGNGDGTFQPQNTFQVGNSPQGIIVADLNGDGKPDLAVTNSADGTVSVLLGNGDGTFAPQVVNGVGSGPQGITAADFNGDAKPDLAVTNQNDGTVSILLGNGDGTFKNQFTLPVGKGPLGIVAGAFTGSGKPQDLVVVNSADNTLSLLQGNGDGSFSAQSIIDDPIGTSPASIVAADFNGDGNLDVAITSNSAVTVLLGNGDGTFQYSPSLVVSLPFNPFGITAGDFNSDGILDLAVINSNGSTAVILTGNGNGTFQPQNSYVVGNSPGMIAAADLDGDGKPDLVNVNAGDSTISVLVDFLAASTTAQLTNVTVDAGTTATHVLQCSYGGDANYAASTSNKVTENYSRAATPVFSLLVGNYPASQPVSITAGTPGALIYYSTDGSTPTPASTPYSGPFNVSSSIKIKASDAPVGYMQSSIAEVTYNIAAAPVITIAPNSSGQTATITDATPGAVIYYTTDGSTPSRSSTVYHTPVTVTQTTKVNAFATAPNYVNSPMGSASLGVTKTPTLTVAPSQASISKSEVLSVAVKVAGAAGDPTPTGTVMLSGGGYTSSVQTLASGTYTFSVPANNLSVGTDTLTVTYNGDATYASGTGTATVTVTVPAATPTFSVAPGTYTTVQTVTITDATTGATIYYTTDGTTPTTASTKYVGPITVSSTETITAIAVASGYTTSAVASATYTISPPPAFSLSSSPSSLSVAQGGSGTSSITVVPGGGFAGPLSLSASGLPSGVTASFAPDSVAGTQVLTLTVSASAQVTSSPLTVTITGTSGSLSATTSVALTITAEPSFTAGSDGTTTMTLSSGATTGNTRTISVVGINGFTGTVNLTCKVTTSMSSVNDMPTCSLNPNSVTISGTPVQTTLTVTTTSSRAENQIRNLFWPSAGGTALAALLLFVVPRGRRNWFTAVGLHLLVLSVGIIGCGGGNGSVAGGGGGGGNSGTTTGAYTITVTGNSGTVSATVGTVTLTVQ